MLRFVDFLIFDDFGKDDPYLKQKDHRYRKHQHVQYVLCRRYDRRGYHYSYKRLRTFFP